MKDLKIEVGKKYLTRCGSIVEILKKDNHPIYPFNGKFLGGDMDFWRKNGAYASTLGHEYDIISEYKENNQTKQ